MNAVVDVVRALRTLWSAATSADRAALLMQSWFLLLTAINLLLAVSSGAALVLSLIVWALGLLLVLALYMLKVTEAASQQAITRAYLEQHDTAPYLVTGYAGADYQYMPGVGWKALRDTSR